MTSAIAVGAATAAAAPCRARPMTRLGSSQARPQSSEVRGERGDAGDEHPFASEGVAEATAEEHEPAERDDVRGDDPVGTRLGEVEGVADAGQGECGDGAVEHDQQLHAAEDHDRPPEDACRAPFAAADVGEWVDTTPDATERARARNPRPPARWPAASRRDAAQLIFKASNAATSPITTIAGAARRRRGRRHRPRRDRW